VRVLLDEDLDVRIRHHFGAEVEVVTVQYRGWKGRKNGELLQMAAEEFDVFVTGDDNLSFQQRVASFDLAVVVLRPTSKALPHLLELMPEVRRRLPDLQAGEVIGIYPPASRAEG
jgi:predicted nuclease of predicted toxin-antitoxin system